MTGIFRLLQIPTMNFFEELVDRRNVGSFEDTPEVRAVVAVGVIEQIEVMLLGDGIKQPALPRLKM
jgi:hypothetical protein